MAAATSAMPAQWHFMEMLLPSAVVTILPCDSQSVNAGAIANTSAMRTMTTPRIVFISSSTDELGWDRCGALLSVLGPDLDLHLGFGGLFKLQGQTEGVSSF